jgi:predicted HD phosphohydrolase
MKTVSFINMADGTKEDYDLLGKLEHDYVAELPARLLKAVEALKTSLSGYQVTRYEHSLQSATRAHRDGRDEEYVVACLLHDIGDELAPYTHGEMTAAILRPYMSEKMVWLVKQHGLFQLYYYGEHVGEDPHARDRYLDHPWYADAVEFCEKYDQNCFDPAYDSLPLEFFAPMVRRVFSKEPQFTW